jgi:SulP family sulfate permease
MPPCCWVVLTLLTSVIADNMTKTRHNSNRELIGQGIGNMLAAAFGESLVQEQRKVPNNAGGKTRISGAIHGLFFTSSTFRFRFISSVYPTIRFGRVTNPIGFKIIDVKGLKHLLRVPRADAAVLILVLIITTFGSLIQLVLVLH